MFMKKLSLKQSEKILREMVHQAHMESKHSGAGSRLKSMFFLQKTSIGMFLDSILNQYKKYASKKEFKEVEELVDLMNRNQDIWNDYQKGGDYPATFEYLILLVMKSLTGKKPDKKIKDLAGQRMLDEIRNLD